MMAAKVIVLTWSVVFATVAAVDRNNIGPKGPFPLPDEKRLISYITEEYKTTGTAGLPVRNTSDDVPLNFFIDLLQILAVDENSGTVKLRVIESYRWRDAYLNWTAEEFGGIQQIQVQQEDIWTTDMKLLNGKREELVTPDVTVFNDGSVAVKRWVEIEYPCQIDVTHFPNDEHSCSFRYRQTGNYRYFHFDRHVWDDGTYDRYTESNEWKAVRPYRITYPDRDNGIIWNTRCSYFKFDLLIKRNAGFYNFVLVAPSVLLSALISLIFLMPRNNSDRNTYACILFIGYLLLLVLAAVLMPHGMKQLPVLGLYVLVNMILLVLAMIVNCFVTKVYNCSSGKHVPRKLNRMIQCLLCLCPKTSENERLCDNEEIPETDMKIEGMKNGQLWQRAKGKNHEDWKRLAALLDRVFFSVFLVGEIVLAGIFVR